MLAHTCCLKSLPVIGGRGQCYIACCNCNASIFPGVKLPCTFCTAAYLWCKAEGCIFIPHDLQHLGKELLLTAHVGIKHHNQLSSRYRRQPVKVATVDVVA